MFNLFQIQSNRNIGYKAWLIGALAHTAGSGELWLTGNNRLGELNSGGGDVAQISLYQVTAPDPRKQQGHFFRQS